MQGVGVPTSHAVENLCIPFESPQNFINSLLLTGSLTDNIRKRKYLLYLLKRYLLISGPIQFKPMLKGQLY